MVEFLVDSIYVVLAGKVFIQIVGIPMGTKFARLLADIFLYSYEAEFIKSLLSAGKKRLAYKKRLLLRCIHHFISDLIYNMDHMRISGTEPSSVIFIQTK